jgi:hypothetical protein
MYQQYPHDDVKASATLTRLQKRIGQVILITLALTFATFIISFGSYEGWFVPWKSLGQPPDKPVKLIVTSDHWVVETVSHHVYQHDGLQCGDNCWTLSDYPQPDTRPLMPLEFCGWHPPSVPASIDTKVVCRAWGMGGSLTMYAISIDGNVSIWEHSVGEGGPIWAFLIALYATPLSLLVALIIVTSRNGPPSTGQGEFSLWKH